MAIVAIIQGCLYFADTEHGTAIANIVGAVAILSGASLVIGFLTPLASTLVGIVVASTAAMGVPPPPANLFDSPLPTMLSIVIAVAIVLLGPGAVSLDAHLFGRREIIIPRLPHTG